MGISSRNSRDGQFAEQTILVEGNTGDLRNRRFFSGLFQRLSYCRTLSLQIPHNSNPLSVNYSRWDTTFLFCFQTAAFFTFTFPIIGQPAYQKLLLPPLRPERWLGQAEAVAEPGNSGIAVRQGELATTGVHFS